MADGGEPLLRAERLRKYLKSERAPWTITDVRMGFLTTGKAQSAFDVVTSPQAFRDRLRRCLREELLHAAAFGFAERQGEECARAIGRQTLLRPFVLIVAIVGIGAILAPLTSLSIAVLALSATLLLVALARLLLTIIGAASPQRGKQRPVPDDELPVVTILAPLYKEAHAIPGLIAALGRLEYPPEKLDIKLLLEEDDTETIAEALRIPKSAQFDIIIVPDCAPRTKPKACNYGLASALGDLVVIYDAEDEPEPGQLKAAASFFADAADDIACAQARLNYYNARDNLLTRLFTLEYCLWFDHMLPALDRLGAPVPLGGTSNIFRREPLIEVGAWDPFNVTEDADLGLRLARRGYRTAIIDSTTYEEANCRIGNWTLQRSRWMKGFAQTWLVNRRNIRGLRFDWRMALSADFFIGGAVAAALVNPFLIAILLLEKFGGLAPLAALPDWALAANQIALVAANLIFIGVAAFAPFKRGLGDLSPSALLMPLYWVLISVAAWRGVIQLATDPSYWEKTEHGISPEAKSRRTKALSGFGLEGGRASRHISKADDARQRENHRR